MIFGSKIQYFRQMIEEGKCPSLKNRCFPLRQAPVCEMEFSCQFFRSLVF